MIFGRQYRYCPNCGVEIYDAGVDTSYVLPMMCSNQCRTMWQLKYAATILGKDAPVKDAEVKE